MTPTVVGDLVYVASCSGVIYAFDGGDGSVAWSYDTTAMDGAQATFHGDPLVAGGLLVVPGDGGWVYAFALDSGELRWKAEVGPRGLFSDVVVAGSRVVGFNRRRGLYALDLETGEHRWTLEPRGEVRGTKAPSPVVIGERVFSGGADGRVYCVEAATGEVIWNRDLDTPISTALALVEGQIVVGGSNRRLYRLDPATGEITAELELPILPVGTPVLAGGTLLLTDYRDFLVAVEADLREVRWSQPGRWSSERALVDGDTVVVGRAEGELAGLRLTDGERVWSTRLDGHIRGLSKAAGLYYVGTVDGTVYAYRRSGDAAAGDAVAGPSLEAEPGRGLDWMTGRWRGAQGESVIEEIWTKLDGDNMMGMFRLVAGGEVQFYEFMSIELESGGPVLRIKHFSKALRGWEEKDHAVTFDLASVEPGTAVWREREGGSEARLTYRLLGTGGLEIVLEKPGGSRSAFEFQRQRQPQPQPQP